MSETHRNLLVGSKSRCFPFKKHRCGLESIETSNSVAKHAVVHAQHDRSYLGPIETCQSGPEVAVLHAKTTGEVLDLQRLVILVLKSKFWVQKATSDGWNPCSLFILVLSTLLCVHKTPDEVLDPY